MIGILLLLIVIVWGIGWVWWSYFLWVCSDGPILPLVFWTALWPVLIPWLFIGAYLDRLRARE